ncbi:MAG: transglycosylase domain-containing protein [Marinilabiliales bacterium]|nr:transglycosylase domain-containing protein [Marinilabiliales bacterium]
MSVPKQKRTKATGIKKSLKDYFRPKGGQPIWKFILLWILKLGLFGLFLMSCLFVLVYAGTFGELPDAESLIKIKEPVASEVFSQDGKVLGRYYIENRSSVSLKSIAPSAVNALIATEDVRFYEHRGIDEWAVLRVFIKTIFMANPSSGGGSTLSQQIAKNVFGRDNWGPLTLPVSKIRESIIAYRLEKLYSKNDILNLYLNTVPFGENTYGIGTAAERYFSTTPAKLTVPQAATLIGLLKANNAYNPRINPERSLQRRNTVIRQMQKYNYLTEKEAARYVQEPLGLKYNYLVYNTGPAPYFREMIRQQLEKFCAENQKEDGTPYNLYTDGLKIYTTIDFRMQKYAEAAMRQQMKELQKTFDGEWKNEAPWGKNNEIVIRGMKRSNRYKKLVEAGKSDKEITQIFKTPVNIKLFAWEGDQTQRMSPLDSVKASLRLLHCGFLAMDPRNGKVKVWIGGNDFRYFQYDHVTSARQVGSAFKPFIYAAALENGLPPDKYYANQQITYSEYKDWTPGNADEEYGGYYSLEGALCKSVNTVAVQVLLETGIDQTVQLAKKMGIEADIPHYPSIALGAVEVPLIQLVKAYCCFASDGQTTEPNYLIRIEDNKGKLLKRYSSDFQPEQVMSPENARIMNHFLQAVAVEGTGAAIKNRYNLPGPFACKTGTTQNFADGWFMGYTPTLVTGCWVGAEDQSVHFRSLAHGQGAYMALPITAGFFRSCYSDPAFAGDINQSFPEPTAENLELLNTPHFAEEIKGNKPGFWDIFKSDKKKQEELKEKSIEQAKTKSGEKEEPASKEEKPSIWKKIKDALSNKN